MISDSIIQFAASFMESIAFMFVVSTINADARLRLPWMFLFATILASVAFLINIFQIPFHMVLSIAACVVVYLLLKRPRWSSAGGYVLDILFAIAIVTAFQILITGVFILLSINIIENRIALLFILAGLIILFAYLSTNIRAHAFFEKYYLRRRGIIAFTIISLLLLLIIIANLIWYHGVLFSVGRDQILVLIIAYFVTNLSWGISMLRERNATRKNIAVLEYGTHLENTLIAYRALVHDYRHQMQMLINLNTTKDGQTINQDLNDYIENIIDGHGKKDDTAVIKDDVLISAMLYQKQVQAKQKRIDFQINNSESFSGYKIPQTDLIDILSNLIENAFEEVENLGPENRIVRLSFGNNEIEIRNKASFATAKESAKNKKHFFDHGFSTKGSGRGYGLYNVLSIAERYHIYVSSDINDGVVVFRLVFNE